MEMEKCSYLDDATLWKVGINSGLYKHILNFLHTTWGTTNQSFFPGPQPISIERRHFEILKQSSYVVCEKTDGVRHVCICTMFDDKKICVLVTRSQEMYMVPLNFLRSMFIGTILDGELVKTNDGSWIYMVYDCLMTEGNSCIKQNLMNRLQLAEKFVNGIMKLKKDPMSFKMKTFWPLHNFNEFQTQKFEYKTDGIILTPVDDPIRSGTHETMFKWKPRDSNTIDFLFQRRGPNIWGMYVQEKGKFFYESEVSNSEVLKGTVDGSIVECQYVHWENPRWWKPVGMRKDKTHPNNRRTFYNTMKNISENIQLVEFSKL